jgi:multidrug resistance efflux pump
LQEIFVRKKIIEKMKLLSTEKKKKLMTGIAVLLAVFSLFFIWSYYTHSPWTRDGKVRADVIALAPDVSGRVTEVLVKDNQLVEANQVLFKVDEERLKIAFSRADALLASAERTRETANKEAQRYGGLQGVVSDEVRLQKKTAGSIAESAYQLALADRDLAALNLERSSVRAPLRGIVTNFNLRAGAYVAAGVPVSAFVATDTFYVSGYFEEIKLKKIKVGAPAEVSIMGEDGVIRGRVESISYGIEDRERTTSPGTMLQNVNPTFNWVRLPQRVPVRIELIDVPKDIQLVVGRTATVEIHHRAPLISPKGAPEVK